MNLQANMNEPGLVNGLPSSNFGKNSAMSNVPLNGIDSSPVHRIHQIPSSQLPPMRTSIPSSQLPPNSKENLKQLTQNYGQLNISQVTPISSPKVQNFGTSTPLLNNQSNNSAVYSPVSNNLVSNSGRTNSSLDSTFENVQLTTDIKNINYQNQENNNLGQLNKFNNNKQEINDEENVKLPYSVIENATSVQNSSANLQPVQQQVSQFSQNSENADELKQHQEKPSFSTMPTAFFAQNPQQDFDLLLAQPQKSVQQKPEEPPQKIQNFHSQQVQKNLQSQAEPQNFSNIPPPGSFQQQSGVHQQLKGLQKPRELQSFSYFSSQPQSGSQQQVQLQKQPGLHPQQSMQNQGQLQDFSYLPSQQQSGSQKQPGLQQQPRLQQQPVLQPQQQSRLPQQFGLHKPGLNQQQPRQQQPRQHQQDFNIPPHSQPTQLFNQNASQVIGNHKQEELTFKSAQQVIQPPGYVQTSKPSVPGSFPPKQNVPLTSQFSHQSPQQKQPFLNFPVSQSAMQSQFPQTQPTPIASMANSQPPLPAVSLPNLQQTQQKFPFQYSPQNQAIRPPPLLSATDSISQSKYSNQLSHQLDSALTSPPLQQQIGDLNPTLATSKTRHLHANRYPTFQQQHQTNSGQFSNNLLQQQPQALLQQSQLPQQPPQYNVLPNQPAALPTNPYYNNKSEVVHSGFSKMWGQDNVDILQCPNVLPPLKVEPPRVSLGQDFLDAANCSPDIFRCTMTKIPETNTLLQKSRLPLGVLIHPFKDLDHLPVIQCSTIVRCRACRNYINPFVFFVDMKRWKCNLCFRVNELPEEFQFDPVSKTYGDPSRRPEIKSSTIEYIAPSEYMLRPPQPAVYIFLLDVSRAAVDSGYLHSFCNVLKDNLMLLPGDGRTQVGFIAYNSAIHFYSFADGLNRPHEMTMLDVDDVFLPCPDNLVVNLNEHKDLIMDLLVQLPNRFDDSYDTGSALGAALQIAHKLILNTGGRISVFQSGLANCGPGKLTSREDPNQRSSIDVQHLNPANDFYKRLALDCSGQQIAVDLFVLNSQYVDLATISGISKFSGGSIHHYPLFKPNRVVEVENFERCLKRYLTRKIGFEAVMRVRCTRGLSIHTFHGNFFVRSTDLLSLPNVNPEAGFGMQVSIDESLSDLHTVCFQAAVLYTSSKGERRIRVHTLCLPIANTLPDILAAADQQCIIGLLAKMAVDRSVQSSLADSREAFINVAVDILSSYKLTLNVGNNNPNALLVSHCLKLLPLYISALLKHVAFRTGISTRLDDRVKAMNDMKTLPLYLLIQQIYPDLYAVHDLENQNTTLNVDGEIIPQPSRLQLSARCLESKGAFLMDMGENMILMVCPSISTSFLHDALGVPDYNSISEQMYDLPILNTPQNTRLNNFINSLNDEKPFPASLHIIRENSQHRNVFIERLIEDRIETALSYHEFLQHLKTQVK